MAADGNSGLPKGHVIAWKADHQLNLKFARELAARMQWPEIPEIEIVEPSDEAEEDPDAELEKEQITRSDKPPGMRKKRMYDEAAGPKMTYGEDPADWESSNKQY